MAKILSKERLQADSKKRAKAEYLSYLKETYGEGIYCETSAQADAVLHSIFKKNGISPAVYKRKWK